MQVAHAPSLVFSDVVSWVEHVQAKM
jgi:hypothetical protein